MYLGPRLAAAARAVGAGRALGRLVLREAALGRQPLVELAARCVLQDQVDALRVPEVAVHAQDVLVDEVRLDLDLSSKLVLDAVLLELRLA